MKIEQLNEQYYKSVIALLISFLPGGAVLYFQNNISLKSFVLSLFPQLGDDVGLAILIAAIVLIFIGFAIARAKFYPRCPSCNGVFTSQNEISVVIATKNCPMCGANVISNNT